MLSHFNGHAVRRTKTMHPYQVEACDKMEEAWKEFDRALMVIPTGGGKSLCIGELCARQIEQGKRCLFVAHTRALVSQFKAGFEDDFSCSATIEMGNQKADDAPMVCASVQTMANRIKSGKWHPNTFAQIWIDEGHHSMSSVHQLVANHFSGNGCKVGGATATPHRLDQKDLMDFFECKPVDVSLKQLIDDGFLCEIKIQHEPLNIQVSGKSKMGDITDEEAADSITPYLEAAADAVVKYGRGKCGLSFLPLRKTARAFRDILRDRGVRVEYVGGDLEVAEQNKIRAMLERGDIEHVTNAMIWGEGLDLRPVNLLVPMRPTRSWTSAMQQYGRCIRTYDPKAPYAAKGSRWPLKTEATILDLCFVTEEHSMLQRPSCMFAATEEEAQQIDKTLRKKGGDEPVDLLGAVREVEHEREIALRKRLEAMSSRKSALTNAMDFFLSISRPDLADYEPMARWEKENLTDGQRDFLLKQGFDISTITSRGMASQTVDAIIQRTKANLCTVKQGRYAESLGLAGAMTRSFEDVSAFISASKAGYNVWAGMPDL